MSRPFALLGAVLALGLTGCASLAIESDPEGATVVWSPNGLTDWRPWPPVAWADGQEVPEDAPQTPLRTTGNYSDTIWVTVEKDGYYRPLPKTAQLYALRREKLEFQLVELPETVAARRRAEGFVRYQGEWVRPEEEGLDQYEGVWLPADEVFRLTQRDKGLVEYEGQWMTPEARDEAFAASQRAQGLVEFRGAWVTPERRDQMMALDARVEEVASQDHQPMDLPTVVSIPASTVQADIQNVTALPMRWILSGPETLEVLTQPYDSYRLSEGKFLVLAPGRYRVAAIPLAERASARIDAKEIRPGFVEVFVAEGFQYQFSYDGGLGLDVDTEAGYQVRDFELPAEIPTIDVPDVEIPETTPQRPRGGPPPGVGGGG